MLDHDTRDGFLRYMFGQALLTPLIEGLPSVHSLFLDPSFPDSKFKSESTTMLQ